jgi:hypothetical protein
MDGGSDFAPGITLNRVAFNATLTSLLTSFTSSFTCINAPWVDPLTDDSIRIRNWLGWIVNARRRLSGLADHICPETRGQLRAPRHFSFTKKPKKALRFQRGMNQDAAHREIFRQIEYKAR